MEQVVLNIINSIREAKNESAVSMLKAEDKLREDLGLTSFDLAELTVRIEDEYGIEIPDEEAEKMQTVGDLVRYVEENK